MNRDFLRKLDLFAGLSDSDLDALAAQTEVLTIPAGAHLIEEGAPGDAAYIVVEGEFEVIKKSDVQNIVIAVRQSGEVFGEMALLDNAPRTATVRAVHESKVIAIRGDAFQALLAGSPTAALSMLKTVSLRLRQNEGLLRQTEKMAALGTLSAGLAHELNNPAAAVRRSAGQLRKAITEWANLSAVLADCNLPSEQQRRIDSLRERVESNGDASPELDPMARSDQEAAVQAWLEGLGIDDAWELAPALVAAGWDSDSLMELQGVFSPQNLKIVIRWLAAGCMAYSLLDEIGMGTERLSEIVGSVKAYSYLDQGPVQQVDLHKGLEDTLVILRHKLKSGVTVKREYAPDLPLIEAHGSELNQVWTNILDNAVDAMQGRGEIIIRTRREADKVIVELQDNGPGIPEGIQRRVFEPFFTTKPPGLGTGLGLHIAYTVVNNHAGRIDLTSRPGMTCFQVTLPMQLSS
ncbi:MAG TPA: ATP-binding protein [Anaerolineales bacterium]